MNNPPQTVTHFGRDYFLYDIADSRTAADSIRDSAMKRFSARGHSYPVFVRRFSDSSFGVYVLKNQKNPRRKLNPAVSGRQKRFADAELGRLRVGKATISGMTETQLREFARNPTRLSKKTREYRKKLVEFIPRIRAEIKKGFQDRPWATAEELRKAALGELSKAESDLSKIDEGFLKINPPDNRTKIYERVGEIRAQKGPGHRCDAACKRANHWYRHVFRKKACIYGTRDGSLLIR